MHFNNNNDKRELIFIGQSISAILPVNSKNKKVSKRQYMNSRCLLASSYQIRNLSFM